MSETMTLREVVDALYALAQEHQRPGLDPDVLQAHPTDHPFTRQLELARMHAATALQIARTSVLPPPRLVPIRTAAMVCPHSGNYVCSRCAPDAAKGGDK